jgi:Sec-independent protein translocase protein TatA
MGDLAKGIKSFKKEMASDDGEAEPEAEAEPKVIEHKPAKAKAKPKTARTAKASKST